MKPAILTPAILMAATLFAATAAHAQSASAASAWPPGPTAQAYPPGPTGQATAQTNNVNVVNVPTVTVGNAVTLKEPARQPLFKRALVPIYAPNSGSADSVITAPAGTQMVIETVSVTCSSTTVQSVGVAIYKTALGGDPILTLIPTSMLVATGVVQGQPFPVHLLVDDSLTVSSFRANGTGFSDCSVTLMGYTTPLQ